MHFLLKLENVKTWSNSIGFGQIFEYFINLTCSLAKYKVVLAEQNLNKYYNKLQGVPK